MARQITNQLRMPSDMTSNQYDKCIGCEFNSPKGWCAKMKKWCHAVKLTCGMPEKKVKHETK